MGSLNTPQASTLKHAHSHTHHTHHWPKETTARPSTLAYDIYTFKHCTHHKSTYTHGCLHTHRTTHTSLTTHTHTHGKGTSKQPMPPAPPPPLHCWAWHFRFFKRILLSSSPAHGTDTVTESLDVALDEVPDLFRVQSKTYRADPRSWRRAWTGSSAAAVRRTLRRHGALQGSVRAAKVDAAEFVVEHKAVARLLGHGSCTRAALLRYSARTVARMSSAERLFFSLSMMLCSISRHSERTARPSWYAPFMVVEEEEATHDSCGAKRPCTTRTHTWCCTATSLARERWPASQETAPC